MRILVLGSGAREHAILLALKGEGGHQLFAAPGNAGIAADATLVPGLDANDPGDVTATVTEDVAGAKIRVNPEAVALPRLLEILKDIQEYVGKPDAPDKVAGEPTPLSEEDFEPAPKPAPVPVKARAGADPVKLLTEAIEVHRRTGMTPLELLDYMNAANRVVEMMNRMNTA